MGVEAEHTRPFSRDSMRQDIAAVLGEPPDAIADGADLLHLGLDSIGVMRLVGQWHQRGVSVGFAELIEGRTLDDWWQIIAERAPDISGSEADSIAVVDGDAPFDLAPMQHAYWVGRGDGQALGGVGAHFYNEFDGRDVDPTRLRDAVRALVRRHDMLRARFDDDGQQQIHGESPWTGLTVHDLRGYDADSAERYLLGLRDRVSHRRLDVARGEVFDVQLSLLPDGATRCHVHIEMLVADAHSFRILMSDLARLYRDPEAALPAIGITYPEYLATLHQRRRAERERDREYWGSRLPELPGPPELPLAVDPRQVSGQRVVRHHHWVEPALVEQLSRRARSYGLTLPVLFLAAFGHVLGRWSATERFLLNLPLYDRQPVHPDVAHLVGDFTNLLLLEVDTAAGDSFVDFARTVQDRMRADAAHPGYTGVDVLRDLTRRRGEEPVGAPVVFTSALSLGELFEGQVRESFGTPGWTMSQTPQVWLDVQVTEREHGLYLNWDVVDGLFPRGLVGHMFQAYLTMLGWLRDDADWTGDPPELLPAQTREVRATVNDTARAVRRRRLHEDVFSRAAAEPDRPALLWDTDGLLTYGELAEWSDRVAAALVTHGVRRGDSVAVTVEKGPRQVVAVLAVLRAGGVYVPVGVDQPIARRNRIHTVAGVRHVVAAVPPPGLPADIRVVDVDDRSTPPVAPVTGREDDLAYLLFTSGSTGEPKGVQVTHRAAVNTIDDINQRFQVGAADRVLAVSSLDFDLSVYDIFALLSVGGAVVCVGEEDRRDAQHWRELVLRHGVTVWQSVPALLDMLLSAAAPAEQTRLPLRLALLGGDWVGLDLAGRLTTQAPAATLVALGGTTETAIHSTVQVVPVPIPPTWRSVPYGLPLANQHLRVADRAGRDRPDWVTGELWIGGRSVAHGYRGDPERTARTFVELDGVRWYRTGDLARYHPDGTVEFLGRADAQVKIRGHRIELGEIEVALERHPAVRRAVVVALGTPRRLAAAVTVDVDPPDLRDFLASQVPAYMVPEQVVPTGQLPLSANAKIDRRAVARIIEAARAEPETLEEPVGDIEREVARIWAELLGVSAVGRRQTFFAAGGDSLVAIRSMSLLATAGLVGANLRQLFATPALCDFAATLRRGRPDRPAPAAVRPDPAHRHEPFPPTDVQRAYWLGRSSDFALGGVGSHWYWEFDGADVDLDRLERAVNLLVRRHDMLRAIFDEDGDQRVLPEVGRFHIDVRDGGDEALSGLRAELAHRVPDPGRWPLLKIGGVRYGDGRVRLGFSFDYIVLDALSIVIFFDELTTLYRDLAAELRPVGVGFRDYVLAAPAAEAVAADQRYWRDRLDGLPPAPPLPLAVDPDTVVAPRFRRREDRLDPQQWRRLTERARRHGVTPASVLAAAYAEVLSAWSGRTELTVNFTLFNRRDVHPDVGHILGDFTSLLLVGYRAGAGERWLDVVRRMQEQVWEGMAHDTVSALWVLREMARREGGAVSMPVVFTSALGVTGGMSDMSFPFGELVWGISQTPQVWLDNQVMERDGGLTYNWDSVEELFPAGLLDAMFDAYRDLLCWLSTADWETAGPPLLPVAQRRARAEANDTAGPLPDGLLHTGFFTRAAEAPTAVAVVAADGTEVSYGDLAGRALRLAGALRDYDVRPGDAVAVTLPRGVDQVAAVLGVLATGALYVPVGLDQPADRRDRIYARADARVVIADADPGTTHPVLAPNTPASPLPAPVAMDPDRLAYAIFTSGSTGEPKGVEITHRAALNTVDDINQRYDVGPADRVLAVSSLDFDLSVYDIFGLLTAGGAVVLVADEDRREARSWAAQGREAGVTLWNSVPALLDMLLVAADADGLPPGLRLVLLSGDWVGLDLPGRLRRHQPEARFVALGGATEAAIWSNACEVGEVPAHWRSVPYGRPLRNQRYRVVDPRGRDCPDWVAGELWIGGAGVAHGYRGDLETTARQFVNTDDGRWYRTGDLGRYWPDGTLEFLGRVDFQVKIRGHRIELGEIEAAAEAHPAVARAVALTVGEGRHRRLALTVVPSAGTAVDTTALVGLLAQRVPSYMVPEQVHEVPTLPLTANGKVDRRALTALLGPDAVEEWEEPPRGDREKLIAELWVEVLDCDQLGRQQSFFALGGDSLLATRLVELLRQRHGVELSLRELFLAPTVAQLADVFDAHRAAVESGDLEEGIL